MPEGPGGRGWCVWAAGILPYPWAKRQSQAAIGPTRGNSRAMQKVGRRRDDIDKKRKDKGGEAAGLDEQRVVGIGDGQQQLRPQEGMAHPPTGRGRMNTLLCNRFQVRGCAVFFRRFWKTSRVLREARRASASVNIVNEVVRPCRVRVRVRQ